jgi:DNA-binding transcriptional LysR family regulator
MLDTLELQVFVRVAGSLSFGAAARTLGLTPSAVSKAVARLEARLKTKLLTRTTRRVRLTERGAAFVERATRILDELAAAERDAHAARPTPSGRLRLELPLTLGAKQVVPLLADFCKRYPEVQLDVRLDDRYVDLVGEGSHAAVRVGALSDSRLVARKLATASVVTLASPAFVRAHQRLSSPERLEPRHCLLFRSASSGRALPWRFARAGKLVTYAPPSVHTFGNSEALIAAAIAGLGVIQVLDFAAVDELRRGALVAVFRELACAGPPISLVCPPEHVDLPKVRALSAFLSEKFAGRVAPWQSQD